MKLLLFSKSLKDKSPGELIDFAKSVGIAGYDLCVRPGHTITPENVGEKLPEVVRLLRKEGLEIPMLTGNQDLLSPDNPTAKPILAAMDKTDIRLIKLGYFILDPQKQSYLKETERIRRIFAQWEPLAGQYGVKICYHTHSGPFMGLNCAALAHLLEGFDPACLGAYIDPGHMVVDGEEFAFGLAMVRDYLSIVALKDVLLVRTQNPAGHGSVETHWVEAGKGMVDWSKVFQQLSTAGFNGPLSIHCEFPATEEQLPEAIKREVAFFKRFVPSQ